MTEKQFHPDDSSDLRKQAEEALRQSHDELQTIYNGMIEGLLITDIETKRFVRVNPAMCRMLGYSEAELLAASIKDIHPPEEAPNDLQRFQAAAEGRVSINEDRPVLRKDGSIFYADITGHRVFYHDRPCLLALFRDITERKQAEEALRQSEERLNTICDSALDAVVMIDASGKVVYCNPAAERMFGYSADEMKGRQVHEVMVPGQYIEQAAKGFAEFGKTGAGQVVGKVLELTALRRNGSEFPIEISVAAFRIKGLWCAAGIIRDITERKRAEEALRKEYRNLKHLLHASDHERQLIAYEIHDGLAQQLAGAIMQFQTFDHLKDKKPKEAAKAFDAAHDHAPTRAF